MNLAPTRPHVRVHSPRAELVERIARACAGWGWTCETVNGAWPGPQDAPQAVCVVDGTEWLAPRQSPGTAPCLLICTPDDLREFAGTEGPVGEYHFLPLSPLRLRDQLQRLHDGRPPTLPRCARVGELVVDPVDQRVIWRGKPVQLSWRHYEFLRLLAFAPEHRVTRLQVEASLYRWGQEIESNAIDVLVHHLRRKLAPQLIVTVRGVGFALNPACAD